MKVGNVTDESMSTRAAKNAQPIGGGFADEVDQNFFGGPNLPLPVGEHLASPENQREPASAAST